MDAFEAIRGQLDSTERESGVVWLTREQASQLMEEDDRATRLFPIGFAVRAARTIALALECDRDPSTGTVFLSRLDAQAYLDQHDKLVELACWLVGLAGQPLPNGEEPRTAGEILRDSGVHPTQLQPSGPRPGRG